MEEKKTEVAKGWPDEDEIDLVDEVPVDKPKNSSNEPTKANED